MSNQPEKEIQGIKENKDLRGLNSSAANQRFDNKFPESGEVIDRRNDFEY